MLLATGRTDTSGVPAKSEIYGTKREELKLRAFLPGSTRTPARAAAFYILYKLYVFRKLFVQIV